MFENNPVKLELVRSSLNANSFDFRQGGRFIEYIVKFKEYDDYIFKYIANRVYVYKKNNDEIGELIGYVKSYNSKNMR